MAAAAADKELKIFFLALTIRDLKRMLTIMTIIKQASEEVEVVNRINSLSRNAAALLFSRLLVIRLVERWSLLEEPVAAR